MGILAWIVFGLIAGMLAQVLVPGDDPGGGGFMGWLITMAIGILGAVIGGFIGTALGFGSVTGFNLGSLLIAILGGILVVLAWRMISRGGRGHSRGVA